MGRRSRKRDAEGHAAARARRRSAVAAQPEPRSVAAAQPSASLRPTRSRRGRPEPPPAPWGSFPLVELCVLLALVLGVAGFAMGGSRGAILLGAAAALGSLAGLELAIREHFAGHRSHTLVLAGAPAVVTLAVLYFARAPYGVMLAVAAAVFATAFWAFRGVFKRRAGGLGWR